MKPFTLPAALGIALILAIPAWASPVKNGKGGEEPMRAEDSRFEIANQALRLTMERSPDGLRGKLEDVASGWVLADGACVYSAVPASENGVRTAAALRDVSLAVSGAKLVIRGKLAGLDVEQTFTLPRDRPYMEERIILRNRTNATIALADLEIGFTRRVAAPGGEILPDCAGDRWIAVPLRHRADDPKGFENDFAIDILLHQPGFVYGPFGSPHVPSHHRVSEGWAWTHGAETLGLFKFCQEHLQFSVVTPRDTSEGPALRFGGACMIEGEPAALGRVAPGAMVDLGVTRYQPIRGGYVQAEYAFRRMLDEKGCRFPRDYNPPIHWEQLYDMEGAWDDRAHRYTKAIVEKEAEKGREYSCEALYLDPGWDTAFATFLWGEEWLGPRREFIREMKAKYGLDVALHCPLATWATSPGMSMGPFAPESWPQAARRVDGSGSVEEQLLVPTVRDGRRNLALLPAAMAAASSVYEQGKMPIHQIPHLADGWYGNTASWIAGEMPAWAEVDMGSVYRIGEVRLGNDHALQYSDRSATELRILVATEYNPDSSAATWRTVAELRGEGLEGTRRFVFPPVAARWVRVEITRSDQGLPRLDEIEVYEADPVPEKEAAEFAKNARRGPKPPAASTGALICLGAKQYLDEAEKRLLANCADGVVFLMYDGNWWNGGCQAPDHGHPVPYRREDHIRANFDLARRVHARYPKVLIEMHDMLAGGNPSRPTPVYYKYGLPGSYDENWGFELMWDPMADLREGRAASLYYYNLGCNVPIYLHIDLRKDNRNCVVLWWYASTCRHLGIGGTHADPAVVAAQKEAMRFYRRWERFYKRGEFYGLSEEIHLHVLPAEKAGVVNVFNLSDTEKTIEGSVPLKELGLDARRKYAGSADWGRIEGQTLRVRITLPPWSAQAAEIHAVENGKGKR